MVISAIVIVAFALRTVQLAGPQAVPPGLHVDEAHNGVDALAIVDGWRPIYLPGNDGREALYSYAHAAVVAAGGASIWALRLTSALLGTLGVAAAWAMARALPLPRHMVPWVAAVTAWCSATVLWSVHFGRLAIRGVTMPLLAALGIYWLLRGIRAMPARGPLVITGALTGLALYAHPVARLWWAVPTAVLLGLSCAAWLSGRREAARSWLVSCGASLAVAVVVALPLAGYTIQHPDVVMGHAVSVSVLDPDVGRNDPLRRVAVNTWRVIRAVGSHGSGSWYHNLQDRPMFDPAVATLFFAGAAWGAWRVVGGRPAPSGAPGRPGVGFTAWLWGSWMVVMALPSVLTNGAPNFSRLVGLMPGVFLMPAIGAAMLASRFGRAGAILVLGLLAFGGASTVGDYFGRYGSAPEVERAFGVATVDRARALAELADTDVGVWVSTIVEHRAVLRYVLADAPVRTIRLSDGLVISPGTRDLYAFDAVEEQVEADRFARRWPTAPRRSVTTPSGAPAWHVFGEPSVPASMVEPAGARRVGSGRDPLPVFGDAIALLGAQRTDGASRGGGSWTASPGGELPLTFWWRAGAPTREPLTLFVHLVDEDGRGFGQRDGPPLGGTWPTSRWRVGDVVAQHVVLPVARDAPTATLTVEVGWYDPETGIRLWLADADDGALAVGRVRVGGPDVGEGKASGP